MTVNRSYGTLGTVWVTYETTGSTAVSGVDFVPTLGRLLFRPGQTLEQLEVLIKDDSLPEGPEMFFVNITGVELLNVR